MPDPGWGVYHWHWRCGWWCALDAGQITGLVRHADKIPVSVLPPAIPAREIIKSVPPEISRQANYAESIGTSFVQWLSHSQK